jgi:sugar transferase (PEP-CTERM/EpsH1 system associated)
MHVVDALVLAGMEYGVIKVVNRLPGTIQPMICCLRHQDDVTRGVLDPRVEVRALEARTRRNYGLIGVLASLFRRERVDVVHSHNWQTYMYAVLGARLARVPVVVHGEHGHDEEAAPARRLWVKRRLAPLVNRFVAVSGNLARELEDSWGIARDRIATIPNGVDLPAFDEDVDRAGIRRELGLEPDAEVVTHVGGMRPVKDHTTLIRAFARAHAARPRARLLIVGGDPASPRGLELEALARELGVGGAVRFAGVRRDVPRLLLASDVYVNSSLYEGMSNTILEAMAARRPAVATAVGGTVELVRDTETGFLVTARDEDAMGERITRLLADPSLRRSVGEAGRRYVEAHHGMQRMVDRYAELYTTAFAPRAAAREARRARSAAV